MMEMILGITSSFIAASLFLLFLSRLRPIFEISKEIAFQEENGKTKYSIKVLNKGARNAINIKAEISLIRSKIVPDGAILSKICLEKYERMILAKFDKKDTDATYAYRIILFNDLGSLWIDESSQFIRIQIFAQDEISNFGKVFTQEYRTKRNSLKEGQFRFGYSLEIA